MAVATRECWDSIHLQTMAAEAAAEEATREWYCGVPEVLEKVASFLLPTRTRVLHNGCGSSTVGVELVEKGLVGPDDVVNADFSPAAIEGMQKLFPSHNFVVADALKMQFETASFDLIVDKGLYDSATACAATRRERAALLLAEAARVLAENGEYLCFSTFGPAEKDMMELLSSSPDFASVTLERLGFGPFEYPGEEEMYLYVLTR